jgi:hypothetical protein
LTARKKAAAGGSAEPAGNGGASSALVGRRSEPFSFRVEESKVREFARAVLDPFAEQADPPVPPTFPMYGVSDFERRFFFETLRLDRRRTLNAGQEYRYERPLRIGDVVHCEAVVSDEYAKTGTNGPLRFVVIETRMSDGEGRLIVTSVATLVETPGQGRR